VTEPTGTPRARALAGALRKAAADAHVGVREVARRMGLSHSVISDWFNGKKIPKQADVARFLAELDVPRETFDEIFDLSRHVADRDWLAAGIPGITQQLAGAMECERSASVITEWAPTVVPGLLQTSDYARAIIGSGGVPPSEVETRVLVRMGRRDIIMRSDPVAFDAIIGEQALREPIASAKILAGQLRHLLEVSTTPTVTIRVVRSGIGWHPGLAGPAVLYSFEHSPSIVLLEHYRTGAFLYEPEDVEAYKAAAEEIRRVAMSPEDSSRLIADIAREMERTT
jgi:transcriptional regulator with XRE-family HTH domain